MRRSTAGAVLTLVAVAGLSFMSRREPGEPVLETAAETAVTALAPLVPTEVESAPLSANPEQKHCIAQTVYHEARGETEDAQRAVAAVVLNRVADPDFPDTPCDVIRQGGESPPCQFSWWCDGRSDEPTDTDSWRKALRIADEMIRNPDLDPTDGATYFHHVNVSPAWGKVFAHVATIGDHAFYLDPEAAERVMEAPAETRQQATDVGRGQAARR